jgi:hypothetical protein
MPQVDFSEGDITISSDQGPLMTIIDGVMTSYPVSDDLDWVAVRQNGEILFFEELRQPQVLLDRTNPGA